ncbi:MAG: helix-turn-helix domain-containing protein [Rhodobacter sp.]|nr:helix-turn-helix domain-containing protein [Paracoccaceae bacterium]MCC0077254.1 helix-turn-helix domain-containing protein [Rhodobacter sp.]
MTVQPAKSALRAFEILELFARHGTWLSVSEIADGLGYPRSSTSVIVQTLRASGYLEVDPQTRHIRPSLRMRMMSADLSAFVDDKPIRSLVDWLSQATGEEIVVATQNGCQVQYLYRRAGRLPFSMRNVAALRPLCRTSMGQMVLTGKSDDELDRLVLNINARSLDAVRLDRVRVREAVREAGERQYAEAFDQATEGAGGVSYALPIAPGQPVISIGICGETDRIRRKRQPLKDALRFGINRFCNDMQPAGLPAAI